MSRKYVLHAETIFVSCTKIIHLIRPCLVFHGRKPLYTFGTEFFFKVHSFTNNLLGLQKVISKRLLLKYYSIKYFPFWENIKTIINSRQRELPDYSKHMSWHGETHGNSDDWLSLNFHRFFICIYKLWYTKWGPLENTVYRKCRMALNKNLTLSARGGSSPLHFLLKN